MGTAALQAFLAFDVFVLGAVLVIALQHARAHFRPEQRPPRPPGAPEEIHLSPQARRQLQQAAEDRTREALKHSTDHLEHELNTTASHVNNLVMRLATEIVGDELERYRQNLAQLHKQAETTMGGISQAVSKHQAEIEAKMAQELEAEKQRLIKQIDTKLGDAVGSFLTETLQHNVDLGSQTDYLVKMLEEHKDDFKQQVSEDGLKASQ